MFKQLTAFMIVALSPGRATAAPAVPDDPVLAAYVAQAVAHSRELAARGHELAARGEAVVEARAGYLPSVTADLRYTRVTGGLDLGDLINPAYAALNQVTGTSQFPTDVSLVLPIALDAKIRIAQPIYAPALGPATHLARLAVEAERTQRQIARREIVAAIGATYYGHARAALLAELLRQTRPLLEENLAVSRALVAASRTTEDAVLRAEAQLAAHDQQLRSVDQQRRAAARALNVLVAAPVEAAVAAPAALAVPALPPDVAPLIARARRARGELGLVELTAQVADEQRALARTGYLPTVAVAIDLGVQRGDLDIGLHDTYAALSLVSSWNLFAGGRDRARVRAREHDRRAIEARGAELADRVAAEVSSAWDAAQVARAAVTAAEVRIASSQAAYDILARRYAAADAPQLEVLVAEAALIGARTDRIVAVTDLYTRLVELDRAIATEEVSP